MNNKKLGGLYGALLGDACGCPYEFKPADKIPPLDKIEMIPPKDFKRSWCSIPVGTYTDDGAQTLCLLKTLLDHTPHAIDCMRSAQSAKHAALERGKEALLVSLRAKLVAWLDDGYMSVDDLTFDSGGQTKKALLFCNSTKEVIEELSNESDSGNGSLMRAIPVALVATSLQEAMELGAQQSLATHPNVRCQMVCALYCGIAYKMLQGVESDDALSIVFEESWKLFPNNKDELTFIKEYEQHEINGSGYVVDAFWSALWALRVGNDFKDVIKHAISLGNDTDTTACIAGGLAGIKFGYDNLPKDWLDLLRGKHLIEPLANQIT